MKALNELVLPAGLKYTAEHVWIKMDGEEALVGISDYAQDQLGEVVFVDLPAEGHIEAGAEFGEVESLKSVNPLYMPVEGDVVAINEELDGTPTLLNIGCYDQGWLIRIKPSDPSALEKLLDVEAYKAVLAK